MNKSNTPFTRETVHFNSAGLQCCADVFRPLSPGKSPVIVMAHGLGGTRNMRLDAFAERFAQAGYGCVVFDYRHFGDSEGEPRQVLNIGKQLEDWNAALSYARSLAWVDTGKVVAWGTSFSGGHVLSIAEMDPGLAAVIAQGLFTNGFYSALAMSPLTSLKLTGLALVDRIGSMFGRKPLLVPVAGRPGETALMNAPDAYSGFHNLVRAEASAINQAAARFALDIIRYYPGRKTTQIKAPVLFCICNNDSVAPAGPSIGYAMRTPRKEILKYDYGHFEIYIGDAFEHVVKDQIEFLERVVPVA